MKRLSLIIPVYNVEKYVARCVQSCLQQNLSIEEFEIIIINDGSTDKSLDIINSLVENQINILVVSQDNSGLSVARNKGLSLAKGEYVWFIDSDDWIQENCLEKLYSLCGINSLDVLAIGAAEYDENKCIKRFSFAKHLESLIDGKEFLLKDKFQPCVPFYICKREFLLKNNLYFCEGVYHEDFEFTPRMLYFASKLLVYNELIYFIYKRPDSITRSINPKKAFDLIKIAQNLSQFEQKIVDKQYKHVYFNIVSIALNISLQNSFDMDIENRKKLTSSFFEKRGLFRYLMASTILKFRIEGFLFSLFPKHTVNIYQLLMRIKSLKLNKCNCDYIKPFCT